MKIKLTVLLVLSFSFSFSQIKTKIITELSQKDKMKVILVDVRTPEEFEAGHLKNAVNINWFDKDFVKQFSSIRKGEDVYLYCRSGNRSGKAAHVLDSLGYKKLTNLTGGYKAWKEKEVD